MGQGALDEAKGQISQCKKNGEEELLQGDLQTMGVMYLHRLSKCRPHVHYCFQKLLPIENFIDILNSHR